MTTALPLPTEPNRRGERRIRPTKCPYCNRSIGLDDRCPHVDELLMPNENAGQWAITVREEPFELPQFKTVPALAESEPPLPAISPIKDKRSYYRPKQVPDGTRIKATRDALGKGEGTWFEVYLRTDMTPTIIRDNLRRLVCRGEAEVIGKRGEGRGARIYALTDKGRGATRKEAA